MERPKYDVVIIGGGPAGMSAAVWSTELGLRTIMLEKEDRFGGQLHWIHNPVENYLGMRMDDGTALFAEFENSLLSRSIERRSGMEIISINPELMSLKLADGSELAGSVIIFATGVRRRQLGVPGEVEFKGRGILRSGSAEREVVNGKRVVVVGGGDAAAENALILSEYASHVYLLHRRHDLRARPEFLQKLSSNSNIEFLPETTVERIDGDTWVESIQIRSNDISQTIDAEFVIVRAGVDPNSELLAGIVERDDRGYIKIDVECRTSVNGFYAVGDVANAISPTIASAVGMGATASKSAFALLSTLKQL